MSKKKCAENPMDGHAVLVTAFMDEGGIYTAAAFTDVNDAEKWAERMSSEDLYTTYRVGKVVPLDPEVL